MTSRLNLDELRAEVQRISMEKVEFWYPQKGTQTLLSVIAPLEQAVKVRRLKLPKKAGDKYNRWVKVAPGVQFDPQHLAGFARTDIRLHETYAVAVDVAFVGVRLWSLFAPQLVDLASNEELLGHELKVSNVDGRPVIEMTSKKAALDNREAGLKMLERLERQEDCIDSADVLAVMAEVTGG